MENSMKGKIVLIAGGSSGMGLAIARKAAAAGALTHIVGRNPAKLAAAAAAIRGHVQTHVADISRDNDVVQLAAALDRVDHVVVTAADLAFKPFHKLSDADINLMLASKFWGAVRLVRHFAPRLPKSGSITFFSGSAAYKAAVGGSIVAALNGALDGLARTLALELAPVRVNVVSPGVVDSPSWDFLTEPTRSQVLDTMGSALPVGRVGTMDELADAAMFVMRSGYTTGTVLQIDGGANA
jgi:NAD(P)-dependent dehydrogenase (short-subunit alcohol dehydrogenase family)